jgi:succinate dehydrogenase / fumarate reductase iron-sulfur subunit
MKKTIQIIITRQDSPKGKSYVEEFVIPNRTNMNVISALMEIQRNPVTKDGVRTTPVVWDCNCLEEVCGACTMVINGKPRQACSALIHQLKQPVRLAPLSKFPLVRDLMVDRRIMFDNLKKVKAWIEIDGTYSLGPGPRQSPKVQEEIYPLSRCMTCGCCMEACPNVNSQSNFMGATAIAQVQLFNSHPSGAMYEEERLAALMGPGGIASCGNSQNCSQVCPKEIALTTSLAKINRKVNTLALKDMLNR